MYQSWSVHRGPTCSEEKRMGGRILGGGSERDVKWLSKIIIKQNSLNNNTKHMHTFLESQNELCYEYITKGFILFCSSVSLGRIYWYFGWRTWNKRNREVLVWPSGRVGWLLPEMGDVRNKLSLFIFSVLEVCLEFISESQESRRPSAIFPGTPPSLEPAGLGAFSFILELKP